MPFTIGGEWIPSPAVSSKKLVQVSKEKRRSSVVTLILNLHSDPSQLKTACSTLKHLLGCGGSVKEGIIELQGDHVVFIKDYLKDHFI